MDRMSHKYRAWTGCKSRRPAEDLLLNRSRGVEIACDFACRENIGGKSNFCVLLFADKRTWLPGIGQRGAAGYRQTYLCASMRRKNFPRDNTPVPRRTPFWSKPQKGAKALWLPGARRLRPTASRNGAELVGGKSVFPHAAEGGGHVFPLTPAAGGYFQRGPDRFGR